MKIAPELRPGGRWMLNVNRKSEMITVARTTEAIPRLTESLFLDFFQVK